MSYEVDNNELAEVSTLQCASARTQ